MAEQRANADRIADLGLGRAVDPSSLTAENLWAAIDQVDDSAAVRSRLAWIAGQIEAAGGATTAADEIERALS